MRIFFKLSPYFLLKARLKILIDNRFGTKFKSRLEPHCHFGFFSFWFLRAKMDNLYLEK